jgi:hypothetical protein
VVSPDERLQAQRERAEWARIFLAETREERLQAQREERRLDREYGESLGTVYRLHGEGWLDEEQADWERGRDETS